jgi:hypothetical protein
MLYYMLQGFFSLPFDNKVNTLYKNYVDRQSVKTGLN